MTAAVGWSGQRTVVIDRPESAGGSGIGFNGGELLLLAIGACYTNDLHREAAKHGMRLNKVSVDVRCDWGGDPVRAQNITYSLHVESDATKKEITDLIEHTDRVAEIHNTLRAGSAVQLDKLEAVSKS